MARFDLLSKITLMRLTSAITAIVVLGALSACGGGSDAPVSAVSPGPAPAPVDPAPANPGTATVVGVELPSNVSVVTANNAN